MSIINSKVMAISRRFAYLVSFYALFRESGHYSILTEDGVQISLE